MKRIFLLIPIILLTLACTKTTPSNVYESVIPTDTPSWGNQYASVTLTEYANFVCPACASFAPLVDELTKTMGSQVRFVFAHLLFEGKNGLDGHSEEDQIRFQNAGECADDEGKFQEYYDMTFQKQSIPDPTEENPLRAKINPDFKADNIINFSKEIGIESETFKQCVESVQYRTRIKDSTKRGLESLEEAQKNLFRGPSTPTFFINETLFQFQRDPKAGGTLEQLEKALKDAMKTS